MKVKVWTEITSVIGDDSALEDKIFGCWRAESGEVQYGIDPDAETYRGLTALEAATKSANLRFGNIEKIAEL